MCVYIHVYITESITLVINIEQTHSTVHITHGLVTLCDAFCPLNMLILGIKAIPSEYPLQEGEEPHNFLLEVHYAFCTAGEQTHSPESGFIR